MLCWFHLSFLNIFRSFANPLTPCSTGDAVALEFLTARCAQTYAYFEIKAYKAF
jgi:hypothetical protein